MCSVALEHPEKNRSNNYLPCEIRVTTEIALGCSRNIIEFNVANLLNKSIQLILNKCI